MKKKTTSILLSLVVALVLHFSATTTVVAADGSAGGEGTVRGLQETFRSSRRRRENMEVLQEELQILHQPQCGEGGGKVCHAPNHTCIENSYIVVFAQNVTDDEREETMKTGLQNVVGYTRHETTALRHAMTAELLIIEDDPSASASLLSTLAQRRAHRENKLAALLSMPLVAFIEESQTIYESADQYNPPWGLDRIDQKNTTLDNNYHYDYSGRGVTVYIVDTGIRASHNDFGGRVTCGFNAFEGIEGCGDGTGHGTHVAGTVGGFTHGVAKDVNLVNVKVLDSSGGGTTWTVLRGLDYVAASAAQSDDPSVANLSLGGFVAPSINLASTATTLAGVLVAAAAGNADISACLSSPASTNSVLTVASVGQDDERSDFSNFGACVDIFAPGEEIRSAWNTGDDQRRSISGTSMACPHVAGVAALYLEQDPTASAQEVKQRILDDAIVDAVINPNGSPNRLLYTGELFTTVPVPPPPSSATVVSLPFESVMGWTLITSLATWVTMVC